MPQMNWQNIQPITEQAISPLAHPYLTHQQYMTVLIEKNAMSELHLQRLTQTEDPNQLVREVALLDNQQLAHVLAHITIHRHVFIKNFGEPLWQALIQDDQPLGQYLQQADIPPSFINRQYWKALFTTNNQNAGDTYYGRSHDILDRQKQVLAHVVEFVLFTHEDHLSC